jgi:hypothetical protein
MGGAPFNFTLVQGDTINKQISVSGLSLSGFTVTGNMQKATGTRPIIPFAMSILSGNQTISWYLDPVTSQNLEPGKYHYQIEIASGSTQVITILYGEIDVIVGIIAEESGE